ncbi:MAG: MFS transporter [Candidatus Synoicihabitans palmerolidicus]|nr:MFS transporter [Candidatus Synoicihabitans palmerolidicus]
MGLAYSLGLSMVGTLGLYTTVFTATWWLYTPEVQWLQLLASGSIAFTQAAFWMMYGSIGADVIDYDELQNGHRREGTFSASGAYMMKVGMVLGTFITGFVLDWLRRRTWRRPKPHRHVLDPIPARCRAHRGLARLLCHGEILSAQRRQDGRHSHRTRSPSRRGLGPGPLRQEYENLPAITYPGNHGTDPRRRHALPCIQTARTSLYCRRHHPDLNGPRVTSQ